MDAILASHVHMYLGFLLGEDGAVTACDGDEVAQAQCTQKSNSLTNINDWSELGACIC